MTEVNEIDIFKKSHLPKEGWLQACFNCYTITSKTYYYRMISIEDKKYKFNVFCCPQCKKILYKEKQTLYKFSKVCDKYIYTHYGI